MLDATQQAMVARIFQLRAEAKALEAEAKELAASLGEQTPDNYVVGDYLVRVSRTVRFDAATAKRNLTKKEFEAIQKRVPDSALAKAVLDERFTLCQKDYGQTLTITRPEEA